ncbi:hypothetical protein V6N12_017588 [Hibiscus sabdariffa]|uniref:Cytochrome P450 n=1 Tax=Hibiscus sabdariffa TaxID=183260 RepID=A0ABR2CHZ4_9ROSI
MAEVLRNPQVLHKAKKELEQAIGKGNPIEECDINCLPYLQAIMKETFRLFCCYSLVELAPDADLVGFRVPEGSQVLVNVWPIEIQAFGRAQTVSFLRDFWGLKSMSKVGILDSFHLELDDGYARDYLWRVQCCI